MSIFITENQVLEENCVTCKCDLSNNTCACFGQREYQVKSEKCQKVEVFHISQKPNCELFRQCFKFVLYLKCAITKIHKKHNLWLTCVQLHTGQLLHIGQLWLEFVVKHDVEVINHRLSCQDRRTNYAIVASESRVSVQERILVG